MQLPFHFLNHTTNPFSSKAINGHMKLGDGIERFVAWRGVLSVIWSNKGTNFLANEKERSLSESALSELFHG